MKSTFYSKNLVKSSITIDVVFYENNYKKGIDGIIRK